MTHALFCAAGRVVARLRQGGDVPVTPASSGRIPRLDSDLRVVDLRLADASPEYHRTLERQGVLDHPLTKAEIDSWRVVQYFPTAPDGNSPEVNALWPSFGPKR